MARYVVKIENWGEWEDVESFDELSDATFYVKANYPHNVWNIFDEQQRIIVALQDNGMALAASEDIERFRQADRWLNRFVERRQRERRQTIGVFVENEDTFSTILGVAHRQRTYDQHRPFHFREMLEDVEDDTPRDKVCWQKDGF